MRKMEYSVFHKRGTKKKSESSTGIEPLTFRTPVGSSIHWATKFLCSSVVGAPDRYTGGQKFDSHPSLRFFFIRSWQTEFSKNLKVQMRPNTIVKIKI